MTGARRPVFTSGVPRPEPKTETRRAQDEGMAAVLGLEHTVIESVDLETDGRGQEVLVAQVRVEGLSAARRCSRCQRRCPGYDTSPAARRWRGLDLGTTQVFLQASNAAGVVSRARGGGRRGALGPAGVAVHHRVRGHCRLAGLSRHPLGGRGAAAGGLAQRGRHRHPGRGRPGRRRGSAGRAAPDRDRRDQLPQGPALPAVRGRSRQGPAGVGREEPDAGDLERFFDDSAPTAPGG